MQGKRFPGRVAPTLDARFAELLYQFGHCLAGRRGRGIGRLMLAATSIANVAHNPDDATIVGTIIHMGRSLQMDVVAEGVETEEQLNFLQTLDCTYVQGLLFGNPMSSDNYLELLLAQVEGTDAHRALFA